MQRNAPRCNGHVATRLECVGEDTLDDGGLLAHRYEQLVIHPCSTTRRTNNANGAQHHDNADARRRPVCMQHARHTRRTPRSETAKAKQANKQASKQANKRRRRMQHATCAQRTVGRGAYGRVLRRRGRCRRSAQHARAHSAALQPASQPLLRLYVRLIGCAMRCVNARCCAACGMLHSLLQSQSIACGVGAAPAPEHSTAAKQRKHTERKTRKRVCAGRILAGLLSTVRAHVRSRRVHFALNLLAVVGVHEHFLRVDVPECVSVRVRKRASASG